jgi:hypothetical protein
MKVFITSSSPVRIRSFSSGGAATGAAAPPPEKKLFSFFKKKYLFLILFFTQISIFKLVFWKKCLRNPKSKFKISEKRKTQTFYLLLFISSLF